MPGPGSRSGRGGRRAGCRGRSFGGLGGLAFGSNLSGCAAAPVAIHGSPGSGRTLAGFSAGGRTWVVGAGVGGLVGLT